MSAGPPGDNVGNDDAKIPLQVQPGRKLRRDGLNDRSYFGLVNVAVLQQLRIGVRHHARRNREAQSLIAARRGQNKSVDSNEVAVRVHQRAAAVAGIDRRVRLHVDERTIGIGLPRNGAHHAHRHRVPQALGASESKDHFALP